MLVHSNTILFMKFSHHHH